MARRSNGVLTSLGLSFERFFGLRSERGLEQ